MFCVQKFSSEKREKKAKNQAKNQRLFFFFGDVSSTGRATCTRTAVDNTDDFSRPNTRVLQSLEQRTQHERVKNERMHETAFDSIAPVLSFVLFSHPSKRERERARESQFAFLIVVVVIQRGKHHPSGISLSPRARELFKRERDAREQ